MPTYEAGSDTVYQQQRSANDKMADSFDEMPVIDAHKYLERLPGWEEECEKVSHCLHKYGILIFRDPRAKEQDNEEYIDLMERYF